MENQAPVKKLNTKRGLLKYILLSCVTFGIYSLVVMCKISSEVNIVATRYDGKKTMHFALLTFIFSWLTCGIAVLVWYHRICGRIGRELKRRGISYKFGSGTFWFWNVLGSCFGGVGPFIFLHKLFKAMNKLNADYNEKG